MKMRRLSLLALSETRLRGSGDRIVHEDYRLIYSGGDDSKHGVGFLLEPTLGDAVEKVTHISARMVEIDLKIEDG
ncbi:hypothetical protein SK128_011858, partial [Halocaridina rubra]